MAEDTSAMTPAHALQTIADVRHARDRLGRQAVGLLWMIWGLLLLGAELAAGGQMADWWPESMNLVFLLAGGALLSIAVWRVHALDTASTRALWASWAAATVLLFLIVGVTRWSLHGLMGVTITKPLELAVPVTLAAAAVAAVLSYGFRGAAPARAGAVAAAVLLAITVWVRFTAVERTPWMDLIEGGGLGLASAAAMWAVGWHHVRAG